MSRSSASTSGERPRQGGVDDHERRGRFSARPEGRRVPVGRQRPTWPPPPRTPLGAWSPGPARFGRPSATLVTSTGRRWAPQDEGGADGTRTGVGVLGGAAAAGLRRADAGRGALGFDSVWTAESWGSDAFTPLTWIAAHTSKIRLGTVVVQLSARTPTATAMTAMTIDHLSNGRVDARPRRVGPAGRRGLVRPAVQQAAGPHPRVRRDHPPGAAPRGPADVRRRVLPAPLQRPRRHRARQAAEDHDPPAARRHPDLPRRRGPEERRPDRRDRRRLAPALLLAVPPGGVRRPARRTARRASRSTRSSPSTSPTTSSRRCGR